MACAIMEAERSHSLSFASWRPRKAGGVVQSESKGLRTPEADGLNPGVRAREDEMSGSAARSRRGGIPPPSAFCSIQALNRLDESHPQRGGQSTESTSSNTNLIQKHPQDRKSVV